MNKKTFKLYPDNNTPFEIEINENETHSLLRIIKERHCKALNVLLIDKSNQVSVKLRAKTFNQLSVVNYLKISIEAEFVSAADSFLEIEVYTGTWEEMILTEVELSFSDSPFYISCNNDKKEFMIGEENHSRMDVKQDPDGGFSIITTIVNRPEENTEIKNHISANTDGAETIGRLYGRIKGRVNGKDFHPRQEENKDLYSVNFNKTLTEGLHPIKSIDPK
jgi:hypothetical protein